MKCLCNLIYALSIMLDISDIQKWYLNKIQKFKKKFELKKERYSLKFCT